MGVQLLTIDTPDLGAISVNQVFKMGSTAGKDVFIQILGEDLDANDSTWEFQQSNDPNLDFELIPGAAFIVTDVTQSVSLSNLTGLYLILKLTGKGSATEGLIHAKVTIKY